MGFSWFWALYSNLVRLENKRKREAIENTLTKSVRKSKSVKSNVNNKKRNEINKLAAVGIAWSFWLREADKKEISLSSSRYGRNSLFGRKRTLVLGLLIRSVASTCAEVRNVTHFSHFTNTNSFTLLKHLHGFLLFFVLIHWNCPLKSAVCARASFAAELLKLFFFFSSSGRYSMDFLD